MRAWKIHTNEHPNGIYVDGRISEKKIRQRMYEYIRNKLAMGLKLSEILYCYGPVYTGPLP